MTTLLSSHEVAAFAESVAEVWRESPSPLPPEVVEVAASTLESFAETIREAERDGELEATIQELRDLHVSRGTPIP